MTTKPEREGGSLTPPTGDVINNRHYDDDALRQGTPKAPRVRCAEPRCASQGVLGEVPRRAETLETHQGHQDGLGTYWEPMGAANLAANVGPEALASSRDPRIVSTDTHIARAC